MAHAPTPKTEHRAEVTRQKVETEQDTMKGAGLALGIIDRKVRQNGYAGPPGSGLWLLLDQQAQQLGIPRTGFEDEVAKAAAASKPADEDEDRPRSGSEDKARS